MTLVHVNLALVKPAHALAKAAWLSSLVYRNVESKDQLKTCSFNCCCTD